MHKTTESVGDSLIAALTKPPADTPHMASLFTRAGPAGLCTGTRQPRRTARPREPLPTLQLIFTVSLGQPSLKEKCAAYIRWLGMTALIVWKFGCSQVYYNENKETLVLFLQLSGIQKFALEEKIESHWRQQRESRLLQCTFTWV